MGYVYVVALFLTAMFRGLTMAVGLYASVRARVSKESVYGISYPYFVASLALVFVPIKCVACANTIPWYMNSSKSFWSRRYTSFAIAAIIYYYVIAF